MTDSTVTPAALLPTEDAASLAGINLQDIVQIFAAHSSVYLVIFDADINFVYLNEAALTLVTKPRNLNKAQVIGQHWRHLNIPKLHIQPLEDAIHTVLKSAQPMSAKHSYKPDFAIAPQDPDIVLTAAGERVFEYHLTPLFNDQQTVYRVVVTAEDITERVNAEITAKAYRDSEARLQALTAALPLLIAHVDRDIRYTYNSPESPRVDRRLKTLRGLVNEQETYLFARSARTSCSNGIEQRT